MQLFYKSKNISKEKSKEKEKGPEMTEIIELARKGQLRSCSKKRGNSNGAGALLKFRSVGKVRRPEFVRQSVGEKEGSCAKREKERVKELWTVQRCLLWSLSDT